MSPLSWLKNLKCAIGPPALLVAIYFESVFKVGRKIEIDRTNWQLQNACTQSALSEVEGVCFSIDRTEQKENERWVKWLTLHGKG